MKRCKLAHLVFLGLSIAASFHVSGKAWGETIIPFKASIAITESVHPATTIPCPLLQGDVSGKGASSQLGGSITLSSTDCIIPTNLELTEFAAVSNSAVLTTPRGTLNFTYGASLTLGTGVGKLEGGFVVIGGTGEYSGLCGGGSMTGVEAIRLDTATLMGGGQGQVTLAGVITSACPPAP